jgi:RNA polymerase sigma-70 factor (ECF subfamily)
VDEIRRACRRKESPTGEPWAMEEAVSPRVGPQRSTASVEIAAGVRHCLTTLAQSRRVAVTLYLQGCSVPEAAHLLRWPTKRTENLVYRGLHDLRRCLRGRGLTP